MSIGQTIYTLIPLDGADTTGVFRIARELIDRGAESMKLSFRVGVGSVVDRPRRGDPLSGRRRPGPPGTCP